MNYMFNQSGVSVIDISNFDTKNVIGFDSCFWGSTNYAFPDTCSLPNFSTSNGYPNLDYRDLSFAKTTTEGGYLTIKPST